MHKFVEELDNAHVTNNHFPASDMRCAGSIYEIRYVWFPVNFIKAMN